MLSRVGAALRSAFRPRKPPQASSSGSGSTARPPGTSPLHNAALNAIATARTKSKSLTPDSTRTILWRLLNQLLVPEARTVLVRPRLSHPAHLSNFIARGLGRVYHGTSSASIATAGRGIGYSRSLSLPSRVALRQQPYGRQQTRAFGAPQYLPRGPYTTNALPHGPHAVANIGLGTARNFSSGRPVFQNLVQNVPIVARALNEAGDNIDDVKRKMTATVMKRAPATTVIIAGGSDAQNRPIMIKPNGGGLRTQDRKKDDGYDVWATQESTMPVSCSRFAAMGNVDRQSMGFASDLQGPKKATNGAPRQAGNHETVKSSSDRCRNVSNFNLNPRINSNADTDVDTGLEDSKIFDHYFTFSRRQAHLDLETSKRCPSPTVQSRADDPAPVMSREQRRTLISEDPFVTTLLIPLAPPVHLIPPRPPLPSYRNPHDLSQSFGYQEFGLHATGSLRDAYTAAHANRVTALFSTLDEQEVWARGATCDAFGVSSSGSAFQGGAPVDNANMQNGMPLRVLRVRFEGWSEDRVRRLLVVTPGGQTRVGREELNVLDWCEISSEPRRRQVLAEEEIAEHGMSLIMPTLDFSSAFSETASASLQQRQQQSTRSPLHQPGQLGGLPTFSPWSSSFCPTSSRTSEDLEFDSMLSDVTNVSFNLQDSFGVESLSDRMSSAESFDDAFDASDELGTEDDDDEEGWFSPPSAPAAASSRQGHRLGRMDESFVVDAPTLPMTGSRVAFSMSFIERVT